MQTSIAGDQCLTRSLAHLKREISERNGWKPRSGRIHRPLRRNTGTVGRGRARNRTKTGGRLAARFYQLKTSHCLTGQYLNGLRTDPLPVLMVPRTCLDARASVQELD